MRSPRIATGAFVLALTLSSTVSVVAARAATARAAKLALTKVAVDGTTVTVAGRVSLPSNTASERKRTQVYVTLIGDTGETAKAETFSAKLTSKDAFTAKHATTLTGALGLDIVVKIGGKQSGKKIVRTVSVTAATSTTTGTGPSAGSTTGAGTPGSSSNPGSGSNPGSPSTPGTQLNGTFELEPGVEHPSGLLSGTYFRMGGIINNNSTALNKEYTLLQPGTEGGFETFAYQEPPTPAFASVDGNGPTGNALANRIVQPQTFFEINFSIVTTPVDLQEGLPDPLPVIIDTDGKLGGQITDWEAQWNGLSFNQGAPKANGTLPGSPGRSTTLPTGSYDATTGHYVLTWRSLIIGGPFNGQIGEWHLEGTFVPEA
jgi:hypothetical protein